MGTKHTGNLGETIAADYLRAKGYTILDTNWRCRYGELDIVAQDGNMLVFVEVKTRRGSVNGELFLSITPHKRQRLLDSAYRFIDDKRPDNPDWRIDVVGITLPSSGQPKIEHMEDALDW